ncbi:beta-N-acetylhexosaminidase [Cohnella soli]|uniref:Beta-N-acetylhexosaminidase n=1 Tax=Cohnella soli TaxID=425005 RepID=A0ABW0HRG8_9BACL
MRFSFSGLMEGLEQGISELAPELGIEYGAGGVPVAVVQTDSPGLSLRMNAEGAEIVYGRKVEFYRALGHLVEAYRLGEVQCVIREQPQFTTNGPMFDVSQGNAVMKPETVRRFLRMMALMGLDMIMLYSEDSYDVPEQPYFGYMRGRYSKEEISAMDRYASLFGIEMIPCIQTLSHLEDVLKWKPFYEFRDDEETLLVGHERTYDFIEQMIRAAVAPVTSRRIHIGMDEAWKLGLGRYLSENGYRTKFEIMNEHLHRVLDITRKLGLEPMMWSDMYFRAGSKTGGYYDPECVIPQETIDGMPKDVRFVYWDYYHCDEAFYENWIRRHKEFGSTPVFAGGIWNWKGFVLNYGLTFASTNAALAVCKREGVKEIIATLWGDDGTECDWYSALLGLQLFAEHGYSPEQPTGEKLRARFAACTGGRYDDFMDIRWIDEIPGAPEGNTGNANPSRCLLWQNVLMGLFDKNVEDLPLGDYYGDMKNKMAEASGRNGEFSAVFGVLERLCAVLEIKAGIGLELTGTYRSRDFDLLQTLIAVKLPELVRRVRDLRDFHRDRWHEVNKPFGWEVIDFRYGGLLMNAEHAIARLGDFVEGRVEAIEELEEERLPFPDKGGVPECYWFKFIPSASRLMQYQP